MADSYCVIRKSRLDDIGDAVRTKTGKSSSIPVPQLAGEILSIEGGGNAPISLNATWKNDDSASANGEIFLVANNSSYNGNYDIMWADTNGALQKYSKICQLGINTDNGKVMDSVKFIEFNKIPSDATKIIAVKNNETIVSYDIPNAKRWNPTTYGPLKYKMIVFSDGHWGYQTAAADIQAMLQKGANDNDVIGFVGAGDLTANGTEAELESWKTLRDTYRGGKPVECCNGNHEARNSNSITKTAPEKLRRYLDSDWVDETEPRFYKILGGDVYIFVPCWETSIEDNSVAMISSTTMTWLEGVLETYRNQRCFLFCHVPPHYNTDGLRYHYQYNGFATGNGAYTGSDLWGNPQKSNRPLADRTNFLNLLDHYKNVIWFSGHSHIKYENQKWWEHLNVMQYKGGARFVHVSSLAVPRNLIDGYTDSVLYAEAEYYMMEVYENAIVLKGYDLINDKYFGGCEYIIDTTPVTIPAASKTLVSVSATKSKVSYYTDESLSTADISVVALFSDGTQENVSSSAVFDTSAVTLSTVGTYTIGVAYTYGDVRKTTSVEVTSSERPSVKTLSSISASKVQSSYNINESLSTADISVVAYYSDNTNADVTSEASFDTSDVDMTTAGAYVIEVTYEEDNVIKTTTVPITVSDSSGMVIILDATFDGTISAAGGAISNPIASIGQVNGEIAHASDANAYGKQLYYRVLSNVGLSKSQKVGFKGGVYSAYAGTGSSTKYADFSLTSTEWTKMTYASGGADMNTDSSHPYVTAKCSASSSATATFPVIINARLQIAYMAD